MGVNIATLDLETDPFKHGRVLEPFCSDFFDGNHHSTFWGPDCVEKLISQIVKFKGIIFAHNGGKFDWYFFLKYLPFDRLQIKIVNGRIALIKINDCELRDSYMLLPEKLAKFGNKIEIDYAKMEKSEREKHRQEIITYLKQDTEGLHVAISEFINLYGHHLTLASVAFSEIKKSGVKIPNGNRRHDELFRQFYYGGRCEVFKGGKIERENNGLFCYDINSAYPFAMMSDHCYGFSFVKYNKMLKNPENLKYSFIDFTGTVKDFGFLPFRVPNGKHKGSIIFPFNKQLRYKVTGWEFLLALKHNAVKVDELHGIYYMQERVNFRTFVEKFYREKLACERSGDKLGRLFAKLIMNSGYGKFALDPDDFKDHMLIEIDGSLKDEGYEFLETFDDWGYSLWGKGIDEKDKYFYNVCTAASITGYVRAMLAETILKTGKTHTFYCDTDSIFTDKTLPPELIGDELGQWKPEAQGPRLWIGGKKVYSFETDQLAEKDDEKYDVKKGEPIHKTASKGITISHKRIVEMVENKSEIFWQSQAPSYSLSRKETLYVERKVHDTVKLSNDYEIDENN
jgi:hypothetical protein